MRIAFLALSIILSPFWAGAFAADDSKWITLGARAMLFYQEGFTMQKSPTIYFDAWGEDQIGLFSMRFTLVDSRSMRAVAEVPLNFQAHRGLHRIKLEDYGVELEPYVDYQWYVSINLHSDLALPEEITNEKLKMAQGEIALIVPKDLQFYKRSCEKESVWGLAAAKIWFDAFACVNELLEASPGDRTLKFLRGELLGVCRDPYDGMPLGLCVRKR